MRIAEVWGTALSEVELDTAHWLEGDDTYHQLARRRAARGHREVVCHLEVNRRVSQWREGVRYEIFPLPSTPRRGDGTASTEVLTFLSHWKPDLVLLHSANRLQSLWCLQNPLPGTSYVLASNSAAATGTVMDEIARNHRLVQGCIFKTTLIRKEFCARTGYPASQTLALPSGIDTRRFCPQPREKDLDCIWTGYMRENNSRKKNLALLLEVFNQLDVRLTLAGRGKGEERLRREAPANVTFTGFIDHTRLPGLLNRHKLFLLPSLFDPAPRALSEALACGLPAIGLDRGYGTEEQILPGKNGCRVRTPREMVEAIQTLMADERLRREMGNASREIAEQRFNLDLVDEKLERFLTAVHRPNRSTEK
jgi:glycosyltransferase involved in cell wall biosynthesis